MNAHFKAIIMLLSSCMPFLVCGCGKEPPKRVVRPPDVTVVQPVQREVPRYLEYTGTTAAVRNKPPQKPTASSISENGLCTMGTTRSESACRRPRSPEMNHSRVGVRENVHAFKAGKVESDAIG